MLAAIIAAAGLTQVHNHTGANLVQGITTTFIGVAGPLGKVDRDIGVLEVDEATVPQLVSEVGPRNIVVTNFFPDQLDRFGELGKTIALIEKACHRLPPQAVAILNADDPQVAFLGPQFPGRVVYYGVETKAYGTPDTRQTAAGTRLCRICGHPLNYTWFYYGQLGHYTCKHCGFHRPTPQVQVTAVEMKGDAGLAFTVATPAGTWPLSLATPGFYNIYNALAAITTAVRLQLPARAVREGLAGYRTSFGRMERLTLGPDKKAFLALIKNPTGCNEVIRTLVQNPGPKRLLILINDNAADGRDISWLWDADFEALALIAPPLKTIVTTGLRGLDMALRLAYGGLPPAGITYQPDLTRAVTEAINQIQPGETLFILPTYTALLAVKAVLTKQGYSANYWEE